MKNTAFDWDKYFSIARYSEVVANSPELSTQRHPTQYSPDRRWVYFSSQDETCEMNDLDALKLILKGVLSSYSSIESKKDYAKLSKLKVDCIVICRLISMVVDDPKPYEDPESLLAKQV